MLTIYSEAVRLQGTAAILGTHTQLCGRHLIWYVAAANTVCYLLIDTNTLLRIRLTNNQLSGNRWCMTKPVCKVSVLPVP